MRVVISLASLLALAALAFAIVPGSSHAAGKAPKATAKAKFTARGSVGEARVTGADPGLRLLLVNKAGKITRKGRADRFGSEIFYELKPGASFSVRARVGRKVVGTKTFRVLKPDANPKPAFYGKKSLEEGLNYVTMRDGVELAMTVRPPFGKTLADAPKEGFPTLVEYSGYQAAAPGSLIEATLNERPDPLAPESSTVVGSLISPLLNYAVVSVQMRGSGCSGGAFDLFGLPTIYDGYDAIETIAAQKWVKGKVGMAGISFSGITQLLTAGTRPPNLAAISPFSVTDDVYTATGYPGGIFNSGFAYKWIKERALDALPSPSDVKDGGQPWSNILADPARAEYDPRCAANQKLRLQTRDFERTIEKNKFRTPWLFEKRAPGWWMNRIKVPTFLVGAFQDEQTGGHFPNSLGRLKGNRNVWITLMNGVHSDALGPSTFTRWVEFLDLFVANEAPEIPGLVIGLSSQLYEGIIGGPALPVQQSTRFEGMTVGQAKNEFRKDPRVRLLMDNGAAIPGSPGALGGAWELDFDSWPVREVKATPYYLGPQGTLRTSKPAKRGTVSYLGDPKARPAQTINDDGSESAAQPNYDWKPLADGKGLGFTSPAFSRDTVLAGNLSADLWVRSSARDTDLQVTVTEVRPDGKETLVQSGWLRASHRKLAKGSTALRPIPTHLKQDAQPMPKGKFALVRVPVFPVAHAFRAGSKIRLNILAPGGDRQIWDFRTIEKGKTRNTVAFGGKMPSKLVLPVLPGVDAKGTPLPAPTALRGQPSRDFAPASNGG